LFQTGIDPIFVADKQSASDNGAGASHIPLTYFGVSTVFNPINSKAVPVKVVPVTTFEPFTKTSAVLPFHFIAALTLLVVVLCNVVALLFTYETIDILDEPVGVLKQNELVVPVEVSAKNRPTSEASLV
jgi:hypothetical protein